MWNSRQIESDSSAVDGPSPRPALDPESRLTGDKGAVLDPIGSLRTVVELAAGESRDILFLLGAALGRDAIEATIAAIDDFDAATDIIAAADVDHMASNGEAER